MKGEGGLYSQRVSLVPCVRFLSRGQHTHLYPDREPVITDEVVVVQKLFPPFISEQHRLKTAEPINSRRNQMLRPEMLQIDKPLSRSQILYLAFVLFHGIAHTRETIKATDFNCTVKLNAG